MELKYGLPVPLDDVKANGDNWEVKGYASSFGNVDLGGDVVMKGAFDSWLGGWQKGERAFKTRFLFSHQPSMVLGKPIEMRADGKGLFVKASISKTQLGTDVHTLLKDGALDSFSIGYIPTGVEFDDSGVRLLKEIALPEFSLVAMPMNPEATVTGSKSYEQAQVQNVKKMVEDAVKAALGKKDEDDGEEKAVSYEEMTLAELAGVVSEVVDAFGVRSRGLLEKLSAGDFSLNESKRTDLQTLLETFSGLDSVRHEVETVLAQKSSTDPKPGVSALALAIQLRQRRLRARGVEI